MNLRTWCEVLEDLLDWRICVTNLTPQLVPTRWENIYNHDRELVTVRGRHPRDGPDTQREVPFPRLSVAKCNPQRLVSTASAASLSALIAKFTSGRPSHDEDQRLEIKSQSSSESHSLGRGGRPGRSPVTTL